MKKLIPLVILLFSSVLYGSESCLNNSLLSTKCENEVSNYKKLGPSCSNELIQSYTEGLFYPLNKHLRGIKSDDTCLPYVDPLVKAVSKIKISKRRKFFRGSDHFKTLALLKTGDCLQDRGFISMTSDYDVANTFARVSLSNRDRNKYIFTIKTSNARSLKNISNYAQEEEYLLLPNTYLKLVKRIPFKKHISELYFREVADSKSCKNIFH